MFRKNKKITISILTLLLVLVLTPTTSASIDWLPNYDKRIIVTVDSDLVDEELTNFPVLVFLNSSRIDWNYVNDNLSDLRFCNFTDGITEFSYEIESYNSTHAWIWVKVPYISNTTDTRFYMYFGDADATSTENKTDVWDPDFVMVQHMNDATTSTILDSTSNDNDGTKKAANEPVEATGKIGQGQDFDGTTYIKILNSESLNITGNTITREFWFKGDVTGTGDFIGDLWVHIAILSSSNVYNYIQTDSGIQNPAASVSGLSNTWIYVVCVYDENGESGKEIKTYVNGVLTGWGTQSGDLIPTVSDIYFGSRGGIGDFLTSVIDEIRVSSNGRSSAWVGASYETQRDEGFLSYSATEEQYASTGFVFASSIVVVFLLIMIGLPVIFLLLRRRR